MLRQMLKSKIHRATVTEASLDYVGSLSVDTELLEAADLLVGEKVLVVNINNGARLETYTIPGTKGQICLNGAAARLGHVGDKVIIIAFGAMDDEEAKRFEPRIVHVNDENQVIDLENELTEC
ncbi:MAG: aspartate 1-decarboxylase [Planctomycetota bacterium]|jgi:aspartate 1-decarboxylase